MYEIFIMLLVMCFLCLLFGVIIPVIWITWEKVVNKNPKSIWQIYKEL